MKNKFLEKTNSGRKTLGSFSELCSPYSIECMGLSGLDYVVIDMEHGPAHLQDTVEGIKAATLRGMTPFVRIPSLDREHVLRLLDVGAMGLIAPCVQGLDDVKELIKFCKYAPAGERGLAFGRASGWGYEAWVKDLDTYFSICNREQLLIPQCETLGCLTELDKIIALEEVAGIFIGPFDLSAAMGCSGQINTAAFKKKINEIIECCHNAGKFCMVYANSSVEASEYFEMGMDSVSIGMDTSLLIQMYRNIISEVCGFVGN